MKWDTTIITPKMDYTQYRKALKKKNILKNKPSKKTKDRTKEINILRKKSYKEFLKSNYWKEVKIRVLKRDGFKCTNCGKKGMLEVHHSTYKNHFKEHNNLGDLHTLCVNCHHNIHLLLDIN